MDQSLASGYLIGHWLNFILTQIIFKTHENQCLALNENAKYTLFPPYLVHLVAFDPIVNAYVPCTLTIRSVLMVNVINVDPKINSPPNP
jgi:hypothetical protein